MDNSWVKLYRKLITNEVLKDQTALQVFIWCLLHVNKKTGEFTTGRFLGATELGLNSNTFYKALKRLEKKHKIVTLNSNNRFTKISLLNWAKYQTSSSLVTQSGNNKVTTGEQQSNTKQDIENKEYKNNNVHDLKNRGNGFTYKKPNRCTNPKGHVSCIENIQSVQAEFGKHFTNFPKQIAALHKMYQAGFSDESIEKCVNKMEKENFWKTQGWDLMDASNVLAKGGDKYVN